MRRCRKNGARKPESFLLIWVTTKVRSDEKLGTGSALDKVLPTGERDDPEATGITILPSQSGKVQVEITRVSSRAGDTSDRKPVGRLLRPYLQRARFNRYPEPT